MKKYNDLPINELEQDKFEFNNHAKKIASLIINSIMPTGLVLSISGQWGSGKSSMIKLIEYFIVNQSHELAVSEFKEIKIVRFNCWWIKGETELTMEFIRQFYNELEIPNKRKVRKLLQRLLSILHPTIETVSLIFGHPLPKIFTIISSIIPIIQSVFKKNESQDSEKSIEKLHSELFQLFEESKFRYLVIIDDIDRLEPDDAINIFKTVKTIGLLPNVMFLLAYDRNVVENRLRERFSTLGPHYLEKIVQFEFPVPKLTKFEIKDLLAKNFQDLTENLIKFDEELVDPHAKIMFENVLLSLIRSPRDIFKLYNSLELVWAIIKEDVYFADYMVIETFKIFCPDLYSVIRDERNNLVVDGENTVNLNSIKRINEIAIKVQIDNEHKQTQFQMGLHKLFPTLRFDSEADITSGIDSADIEILDSAKRVCTKQYFDNYFKFY